MRLLLILAALLTACGSSTTTASVSDPTLAQTPTPTAESSTAPSVAESTGPTEAYTLHLEVEAFGADEVSVRGTTNLPDGATIDVFASRAFRYASESDIRATSVAHDEVTVTDGSFSAVLSLDESNLLFGLDPDPIEVIDSDLHVCAQFQTGEDVLSGEQRQSDATVIDAVGASGERLEDSPQVEVFGSATDNPTNWLEISEDVASTSPLLDQIESQQRSTVTEEALDGFCVG